MAKSFSTPAAFRESLETRLKLLAGQRGIPMNTLRLKLVMERLLARLFVLPNPPWLLKGGYAMELRYRPRARTTRDIDLSCRSLGEADLAARLLSIREALQIAAAIDLGDHLTFLIAAPERELDGAPDGGARFPCEAILAGRSYGRFHIDLGFGDEMDAQPDTLVGDDLFSFMGVPPGQILSIPKVQQFAEKIHAYTFPWADRTNTRTKDLLDLVLMIETGGVIPSEVLAAIQATFLRRKTHEIPNLLLVPPPAWAREYSSLAAEAQLTANTLDSAFETLRSFWLQIPLTS
jgi:Nucleotidyl transferase AbiEii toxin, Type IV TA system